MYKKILSLLWLCPLLLFSQRETTRPPLWGICKMTYLVSSYELSARYYGEFLGFDKAFEYDSPIGRVHAYKVNNRQFLEFIADGQAKEKDRFVAITFETEDAEQMRSYLYSKGVKVPSIVEVDGAGNRVFSVTDQAGVTVEFLEWGERSLHRLSKDRFLSDRRISDRIHHAGLYSEKLDDNPWLYKQLLGFKTSLRIPETENEPPTILYFQIPGTAEFIEHYPTQIRAFSHPCFVAKDMQEVMYTLKERRKEETLGAPMVGKGRRWILNIHNSDGTRVEFTEMFLAK